MFRFWEEYYVCGVAYEVHHTGRHRLSVCPTVGDVSNEFYLPEIFTVNVEKEVLAVNK